jgi:FkbM family methyltransferase
MWHELFTSIWSNVLYFLARAFRSNKLVARAATVDPMNYRAIHRNAYRNGADVDYLAKVVRMSREGWGRVATMEPGAAQFFAKALAQPAGSQAQVSQDLFVLLALKDRRNGYFVEVGVGTGEILSNTCMLERSCGWTGILAEPNPVFHESIRTHRKAILDTRAVFSQSGQQVEFLCETSGELSGLVKTIDRRNPKGAHNIINVTTVTLTDLLFEHGAPAVIDYISIDTEGSEFDILQGLDFSRFRPLILTIEHADDWAKLEKIKGLLAHEGYSHVLAPLSQFDAFFVHKSVEWPPKSNEMAERVATVGVHAR